MFSVLYRRISANKYRSNDRLGEKKSLFCNLYDTMDLMYQLSMVAKTTSKEWDPHQLNPPLNLSSTYCGTRYYVPVIYTPLPRKYSCLKKQYNRASLVARWLRIRLPVQGTQVRALVWEDPTCHGATGPVHHNYWACALEPAGHGCRAHVPHLLKPAHLRPAHSNEDPTQPKIKINKLKKKHKKQTKKHNISSLLVLIISLLEIWEIKRHHEEAIR